MQAPLRLDHNRPLGAGFPYTGSKMNFTLSGMFPEPQFNIIIEPFVGSGCFSRVYHQREVIIMDINRRITNAHRALQKLDTLVDHLPDYFTHVPTWLDEETQDLLMQWSSTGTDSRRKMTAWAHKYPDRFWNERVKQRLVYEAQFIKHWQILDGSFWTLPDLDIEATWFIDPPYQFRPGIYKYHNINYRMLRDWVMSRRGQIIVCEGGAADWLPFVPFAPGRLKTGQPRGGVMGDAEVWFYRETWR